MSKPSGKSSEDEFRISLLNTQSHNRHTWLIKSPEELPGAEADRHVTFLSFPFPFNLFTSSHISKLDSACLWERKEKELRWAQPPRCLEEGNPQAQSPAQTPELHTKGRAWGRVSCLTARGETGQGGRVPRRRGRQEPGALERQTCRAQHALFSQGRENGRKQTTQSQQSQRTDSRTSK